MGGLIDRVYERSPVLVQQALVSAYGAWWYRRRFGPRFHRFVSELQSRSGWGAQQWRAYQSERLGHVLAEAGRSEHYHPLIPAHAHIDPLAALTDVPVLSKETLRAGPRRLLTGAPPRGTMVQKSSGTTGTPSEIYYTRDFHALELAVPEVRNMHWAGVNYRDRRVMFGARKICRWDQRRAPFWRLSPVENMAYCSIYHLSPAYMGDYVEFLRRYNPTVIMGYPSALATLARFILQTDARATGARAIVTLSETVTAEDRAAMEAAWNTRLWDRYGAVEGCVFASQCQHGRYHVSPDVGLVEILDDNDQPCPPGVIGQIVATGLHNTLQPLIRYRLGDAASWAIEQECPCGRKMPILESIEGRFEDLCITADGREVLRFDTVFKGVSRVKQAQVIQHELERFEILVVPAPAFSEHDAATLRENMYQHVGRVKVDVTQVPEIPRSSSGKFRAVLCKLDAATKRQAIESKEVSSA